MDIPIDREEYENARHNNKKRGGGQGVTLWQQNLFKALQVKCKMKIK